VGQAIVVRWETVAEVDIWGFHIYRSATGKRADAVRITPQLILARGHTNGALYTWTDAQVDRGVDYTYWLAEAEVDGATNEYGPAPARATDAAVPIRVFLPLLRR
jgi:hypothetical protein